MRAAKLACVGLLILGACRDSTGPERAPAQLTTFLLEEFDGASLPILLSEGEDGSSITLEAGELHCLEATGGRAVELYQLTQSPGGFGTRTLVVVAYCELVGSDSIRYSYPSTGEVLMGEIWEEGKLFYQRKRLPSPEVIMAAPQGAGIQGVLEGILPSPMPMGLFKEWIGNP